MSIATMNRRSIARSQFDAENKKIMNLELAVCSYQKDKNLLTYQMQSGDFPDKVFIRSHHTGKVVCFTQDRIAAERNEWWDGEMMEYITLSNDPSASKLTFVIIR